MLKAFVTGADVTLSREDQGHPRAPRWSRRHTGLTVTVAALVAVAGAVTYMRGTTATGAPATWASSAQLSTVPVISGALVDVTEVRGTLQFADDSTVVSGSSGVVTSLPAPGRTIAPGQALYTLNTRPVVLLKGAVPAWRSLQIGIADGEDVRQLERGLAALGWFDLVPDTRFTASTAAAVRLWQRDLGLEQTGSVARSAIVFATHQLRVSAHSVRLGAQVAPGTELYATTGTDKVVTVDLDLDDQQLAVRGATVSVVLPDGTDLPAVVTRVGEAVEQAAIDGATGTVVVPVTIRLTRQSGAAQFSEADVTARFTSTLGDDLLTVPVEALLALDATSFGIEVPNAARTDQTGYEGRTTIRPVTVGAFASGRVAISGNGIVAGLPVVVPAP